MTRTSVSNAVFLTTELLENILCFLSAKSLLKASCVSRKWRDVVAGNQRMQETLFLKAARPTIAWKWSQPSLGTYRMQRLADLPGFEPSFEDGITLSGRLNGIVMIDHGDSDGSTAETAPGGIFGFGNEARWRFQEGCWGRMFVTQPPATKVFAEYILGDWEAYRSGYDSEDLELSHQDGVTVGQLVDHGLKLESEGKKVNWERCWFQAWCRVFTSVAEEELKSITG
ncbi:hypothetical protein LTR65_010738 [Meristemomyces frigidus]